MSNTYQPKGAVLLALCAFADSRGRTWKRELATACMQGRDTSQELGCYLRQMRNAAGVAWLQRWTAPDPNPVRAAHCIKILPDCLEVYGRDYRILASVFPHDRETPQELASMLAGLLATRGKRLVETWEGWTGGVTSEPGAARWFE